MTTLDEKGLESAIEAGNRSYNELRCRFDDAIYAAIRAYLATAPDAEAARWKEAAEQADARSERLLDHAEDVATRRVNAEALAAEHAQREVWTRERAERAESINAEMLEALRLARSQIDDFETNDATLKQIDDLIARAEAATAKREAAR